MWAVREGREGDYPAASDLWRRLRNPFFNYLFVKAMERVAERIGNAAEITDMLVAERDGHLVGYLIVGGGVIHALLVEPQLHRQGIGTALLEAVFRRAEAGGALGVYVHDLNSPGLAFFRRRGFGVKRTSYQDNAGLPYRTHWLVGQGNDRRWVGAVANA